MIDETVVIGAGPYGLSAAAHLRARGAPVRVFGEPMAASRSNAPLGTILSPPAASNISGPKGGSRLEDFCAESGYALPDSAVGVVPLELFVEYGGWFADRNVPDAEAQHVLRLSREGDMFAVTLADGEELRTRTVVMATGPAPHRYVPSALAALAGGEGPGALTHAGAHADLSDLAGRRAAIVGGGHVALETAALAREAGADVVVLAPEPRIRWESRPGRVPSIAERALRPASTLGPGWMRRAFTEAPQLARLVPARARLGLARNVAGRAGAWWLRDRVEGLDVRAGISVTRAEKEDDGRALLEIVDATAAMRYLRVDHVVAATGYRVDVDHLDVLDAGVRAAIERVAGTAAPALDASLQSSVPGLFFAGATAAATFGPLLQLACGTEFSSPRIAAALEARA